MCRGGHAASGGFRSGLAVRAGARMPRVAGLFLDGLADFFRKRQTVSAKSS